MSGYTYDAGVLIGADRDVRSVWVLHRRAMARGARVTVPAAALAQAWRGGPQPLLSRLLQGCEVEPLDESLARSAGATCAVAQTADVVDAAVVAGALRRDDLVVTTDPKGLRVLVDASGGSLRMREV